MKTYISPEYQSPDDLVDLKYDPEIGFAYDSNTGRLWRVHEVETTKTRLYGEFVRLVDRRL